MAMAKTGVAAMVLAAALFFSTFSNVSGQAEAPSPSTLPEAPSPSALAEAPTPSAPSGCLEILTNMSDCLAYVEDGSKTTRPDKGCCPELAGLVDSNPICLCQLLGSNITESFGIKIDLKRALKLPSVCGVETPPVSTCSVLGFPVPPIGAPGAEPAGGPGAVPPSTGDNDNGDTTISGSALPLTVGLAIAFLPNIFLIQLQF